jgi:hypothetical protein
MKALILLSLLVSSVSFANRESGGRGGATAVYVDFRSTGAGIASSAMNTYKILVNAAQSRGEVIDVTTQMNGREGGRLECVQLMTGPQRYQFIQSLAFSIRFDTESTGMKRTAVYVGMDCHSFNAATEQDLRAY